MRFFIFIGIILLSINSAAAADRTALEILNLSDDNDVLGAEIAKEFDHRDRGFEDVTSQMAMVLRNAHGEESRRKMRLKILEIIDDEGDNSDYSFIIFDTPRDVSGTALLSHAKILSSDNQWLYLPALKRVKRISSKNKSGPFVGSEFAYEDITSNEVKKYTWALIGVEEYNGMQCFKLKRIPRYENSGYSKQLVWIDQEHFRLQKVEYYDRKNSLLKIQTIKGYKQYLNRHWRAEVWVMHNQQNGKSTELIFNNYKFKTGLSKIDFDKSKLKSAR